MTPVTILGSCLANQVVRQMPDYNKRYTMWPNAADTRFREKLSADFTPAGNIADRLYDEMHKGLLKPSHNYQGTMLDIKLQFDYVTKPVSIQSTIDACKMLPGSVIYVDLTNELLPSVITQDEEFLLKNNWQEIAPHFPQWFQDIVAKNTYQFDMYDKTMTIKRHHALRKMVHIVNSAKCPVVALGNVYTNKVLAPGFNKVVENISFYNSKIPFLNVDRSGNADMMVNFKYIKHQIDEFYKMCARPYMSPGWTWIETEPHAFADPDHEMGPHPIHLHKSSRKVIAYYLQEQFDKHQQLIHS